MTKVNQRPVSKVPPVILWVCTAREFEKGLLEAITGVVTRINDACYSVNKRLGQASGLFRKVILGNA